MQSAFTSNIIPSESAEPNKMDGKWLERKVNVNVVCFPLFLLDRKNKKDNLLSGKYQKYFIGCVENIRNFTRENAYIFNAFDEIYLFFT